MLNRIQNACSGKLYSIQTCSNRWINSAIQGGLMAPGSIPYTGLGLLITWSFPICIIHVVIQVIWTGNRSLRLCQMSILFKFGLPVLNSGSTFFHFSILLILFICLSDFASLRIPTFSSGQRSRAGELSSSLPLEMPPSGGMLGDPHSKCT